MSGGMQEQFLQFVTQTVMLQKALFNLHLKLIKKCRFTDTKILDLTKELFIVQIPEIEIVCNI